ncbi:phosphodiesterase [Agromyces sp. MMS24-JH15]|uniref:phosphodiesterase n=1 Tax=Agromyces sp. MMS24-JH15 TaxID=3243765 RepID=UPI003748EB33
MDAPRLGRYPTAQHVVAHVSDLHLRAGGAPLGGIVDTVAALAGAVRQLGRLGASLDAIVVTGDVADVGEADAYRIAREHLAPVAAAAGAELVWTIGNHDERGPFRAVLLGGDPDDDTPVDHVAWSGGLRIVSLDTSVPGWHHGEASPASLDWLSEVLAERAPAGTLLTMHHAPIPSPVALMDLLELRAQDALADLLRGSDVRAILGGHLHYPTNGLFAGIPVTVAGALAYAIDVSADPRELIGVDGGRSFSLVHCFADGSVVSSAVPVGPFEVVARFDAAYLDGIERLDPDARFERFSRKASA